MSEALVLIHDAINIAMDAVQEHGIPSRELGQVEHKLIEAKLWLGTVEGAFEAIAKRGESEIQRLDTPTTPAVALPKPAPVAAPSPAAPVTVEVGNDTNAPTATDEAATDSEGDAQPDPDTAGQDAPAAPAEEAPAPVSVAPVADKPLPSRRTLLERLKEAAG